MKTLAVAVCAALGLLSLPARAADDSGFYAGAGIGQASINTDSVEIIPGQSYKFDANDTAFKIFGGWRLNKYLGFELDYMDLGNPSDTKNFDTGEGIVPVKTEIGVTAWAPYVVGTLPVGPFELSAKLGYAWWNVDFKASATGMSDHGSDSGDDFAWGVGAGMTFFDHFNTKLEYEAVEISHANTAAIWLTGAWRF
jgi:OOP family OmpA-OmpF porin